MNVISRGVRNAFRNGIRTLSIVLILSLSIGLALSMLLARQAVDAKIQSVKSTIGNVITVTPAGVNGFEGGGEPLTNNQIAKISSISGVSSVTSTLSDRLQTGDTSLQSAIDAGSLGRRFNRGASGDTFASPGGDSSGDTAQPRRSFTPPITVTGSNNTTTLSSLGDVTLQSGAQIDGKSNDNVALIGSGIASKNNLNVGSTFTAYNATITVKGIIDAANNRFAGNSVVMPLATLQRLSAQANAVTAAVVTTTSIDNVDSTVTAIKGALGDAADVTSAESAANQALSPLESIRAIALFGLIAAVIAGGIIILLTMLMIVRERRREIGVLKAIGASDTKVAMQFMAEAATFTLLAAIIGIGLGVLAANPITSTLVSNAQSSARMAGQAGFGGRRGGLGGITQLASVGNLRQVGASVDWTIVLYGLGAALLIALIGSAVATLFITKVRPAEAIRAE